METKPWRASKEIQTHARALRREMTPAEKFLWPCLRFRNMHVHFRRQHPIGNYIVDFCCVKAKLIVEIDGDTHDEQVEYDAERTQWLNTQKGYRVMRFTNEEVFQHLERIVQEIERAARGEDPHPA